MLKRPLPDGTSSGTPSKTRRVEDGPEKVESHNHSQQRTTATFSESNSSSHRDTNQTITEPLADASVPNPSVNSRSVSMQPTITIPTLHTNNSGAISPRPDATTPASDLDFDDLFTSRRARPTGVENKLNIMRVPVGNERPIGVRERLLGAVQKQIHTPIRSDQVRLLIIKPGSGDEEINASLLPLHDKDFGSARYQYEALSYHWGEGDETNFILIDKIISKPITKMTTAVDAVLALKKAGGNKRESINAKRFHVRENLYEALKQLRHPTKMTPIWVDALCIHQANWVEKKEQVMKMGQIYHKARSVCVWLGAGDTESYRAMDFIKEVIDEKLLPNLLSEQKHIPKWISLYRLLEWSWFTRRWVIQELALAKEATVHCGDRFVHWNDFRDAIGIFHRYFPTLKWKMRNHERNGKPIGELDALGAQLLVDLSSNVFRIKPDGTYQSTKSLEMLVSQLAGFDTADPRDTIHALRSISRELYLPKTLCKSSDEDRKPEPMPEPNYNHDLFQVYRGFVKWVITTTRSLDIICRQWALPERKEPGPTTPYLVKNLPTWIQTVDKSPFGRGGDVYRGRRAGESFVGLPKRNVYNASGGKDPEVQFGEYATRPRSQTGDTSALADNSNQDMSLSARGLLVGHVTSPPNSIPDGVIPQSSLEILGWSDHPGTEIEEAPAQLWRTLVADRGPKGEFAPTYYHRACLYTLLNQTVNGHLNAKELLTKTDFEEHPSITQDYLERVLAVTWDRSILEADSLQNGGGNTAEKLVGLGPPKTLLGDVIAILYGCSVPVILRPAMVDEGKGEEFEFVGEAYIYGKMDGEAMYETHEEKMFKLV